MNNLTIKFDDKGALQETINILREWVFVQTKPFSIFDIYENPDLSAKLKSNIETMLIVFKALNAIGCSCSGDGDTNISDLMFTRPNVKHVHRDENHLIEASS